MIEIICTFAAGFIAREFIVRAIDNHTEKPSPRSSESHCRDPCYREVGRKRMERSQEEFRNLMEKGYHKITYVEFSFVCTKGKSLERKTYALPVGKLGSMSYLLNEDLRPYDYEGYHKIDFYNNRAHTGAGTYFFDSHERFIESGGAEKFRIDNKPNLTVVK